MNVRAAVSPPTPLKKDSPIIMNGQILHSITAERLELVRGLEGYMRDVVSENQRRNILDFHLGCMQRHAELTRHRGALLQVNPILKPVDKCWQPADFLPPSEDPDFIDKVTARAKALRSDENLHAWRPP